MNRATFMEKLKYLLRDLPEEERQDALKYYDDYFKDAPGVEEDTIVQEFGSPEEVAAVIKANFRAEEGAFTESGYKPIADLEEKSAPLPVREAEQVNSVMETEEDIENSWKRFADGYQTANSNSQWDESDVYPEPAPDIYKQAEQSYPVRGKNGILWLILGICTFPFWFPVIITVASLFFTMVMVICTLTASGIILILGLYIVGVVMLTGGAFKLLTVPAVGLALAGTGLMLLALGMVGFRLGRSFFRFLWKGIPACMQGMAAMFRWPFKMMRGGNRL